MSNGSGIVLDSTGAAIVGAVVTLKEKGGLKDRAETTHSDGSFSFTSLRPSSYLILAKAAGFQESNSTTVILRGNESSHVPNIVLSVATTATEVVVRPTDVIADQQIRAEEQQRVFGLIPNFYTSYVWDAAPLTTKQKFSLSLHDIFDPVALVGISATAGVEQATNAFSGYGQGAQGYGKRWGAQFANTASGDLFSRAVFPSLLHEDPRYFYQGSGSTWSRINHALSSALVTRSDSGHLMPDYSNILGDICSGALSNLYYPASSRGANLDSYRFTRK